MKITEITVGKSQQVVQYGMPEQWIKIHPLVIVEDGETFEEACEKAFAKVNDQIEKELLRMKEKNPGPSDKPKPKMDMVMLRKYEDAVKIGDAKTISQIENNYDVIA